MNNFNTRRLIKSGLFVGALLIGAFSMIYTNNLATQLRIEESKKLSIWAQAQQKLIEAQSDEELSFYYAIVEGNKTIPVIWENTDGTLIHRNLDSIKAKNSSYVKKRLEIMKKGYPPIKVKLVDEVSYLYYDDSNLVRQLKNYPFYQLGIIALFIGVSYLAFSTARKSEQNKVWVGLAKETAHQLGTPISSLMAWVDLIELDPTQASPEAMDEMRKDIYRLNVITERFSKIGSAPVLEICNINDVIAHSIGYMKSRTSPKITYQYVQKHKNLLVSLNIHLFEWVIENICKNAIDAMQGSGRITVRLFQNKNNVIIDITDDGKGIPPNLFKTVFRPGYTTKKRGWGLGLSLVKRIIEEYHKGQIIVKESIPNTSTTFRITLKCESAAM